MDGCEFRDGFQLNDDKIIYEQIDAIACVNKDSIIVDRLWFLPLNRVTPFGQFVLKACFISTLWKRLSVPKNSTKNLKFLKSYSISLRISIGLLKKTAITSLPKTASFLLNAPLPME